MSDWERKKTWRENLGINYKPMFKSLINQNNYTKNLM